MTRPALPTPLRMVTAIGLVVAAIVAACCVITTTAADRFASVKPARALQWQSTHPLALLAIGQQELAKGKPREAATTMRRLLAVEPLQAGAYAALAAIAHDSGQQQALSLQSVAVRRAPRDLRARLLLMQDQLTSHKFTQALRQLGEIMQVDPARGSAVLRALVGLVDVPGFSEALVPALAANPSWRGSMLSALQARDAPAGAGPVLAALRRQGSLDDEDFGRWLDTLMRTGHWGEAYGRWASNPALANGVLPVVYNGGFDTEPGNIGFDWRLKSIPGVLLEFVTDPGADGLVAHATFLRRTVAQVGLEQPLLLMPGSYRLTARMRAERLHSDRGLEWDVSCADKGKVVAGIERVEGSFGWKQVAMDFEVPDGCNGQWLRLRNPAPRGSAQTVSGELWIDDVEIRRLPDPPAPAQIH